jgi:flagellar biosynthesis protein FlhG
MDGNITSPLFGETRLATQKRLRQIWAIGGGKGGVGKSLLSSSLAISLSRTGHKVLAIDLDLGGANLHTTLGVELPRQTLNDFFSERVSSIDACVAPTSIPNLDFISGAQDSVAIANVPDQQKARFLQAIRDVDADYVIFDLGAGTSSHTLDFFLAADINLVTMLPEPTSIENGYRFLKSAYFRRLWLSKNLAPARQWIEVAMDAKNNEGIRSPSDLFRAATREHPELAAVFKTEIERFRPKLILNQVRTHSDIEIGFSVKTVCKKYFGIDLDYLGYLDYDSAVWQAIRRKRPVMLEFPNSKLVTSIDRLVDYILKKHADARTSL